MEHLKPKSLDNEYYNFIILFNKLSNALQNPMKLQK